MLNFFEAVLRSAAIFVLALSFLFVIACVVLRVKKDQREKKNVLNAIKTWAGKHPEPKKACIYIGRTALEPAAIPDHLVERTEAGQTLWKMISNAKRPGSSVEEIVTMFERSCK